MYVIKMRSRDKRKAKRLSQELPFYNVAIEKPNIRGLKKIDLLQELPFHDRLNTYEISRAFGWYARSYKVEPGYLLKYGTT